jgi:phytoene dehydrogenase-like protein
MHNGNAGFPAGASLEFARRLERRYLELGGEIHYKSQVEKILVDYDKAKGVRLYNDKIHRGDIVISAADGRATIFDLLGGEYVDRRLSKLYANQMPTYSQLQVSLGIKRDLSIEPHWVTHILVEPFLIAGEQRRMLSVKNYAFDPSLAPSGKSVLEVILPTTYGYWQHIYGHRLYVTEQDQVADQVIAQLEKIYPGISGDVEAVDVCTPLSYERYTGNWMGANTGWLLTDKTMMLSLRGIRKTLPGLKNFYMTGQWVEPGGLVSVVAMSGRNIIQEICHREGVTFNVG